MLTMMIKLSVNNSRYNKYNSVNDTKHMAGIHSEIIRAGNFYTANNLLNEFCSRMSEQHSTFKVINVTSTSVYSGVVYTVTYSI